MRKPFGDLSTIGRRNLNFVVTSEAVVSASAAGHDVALTTLVREVRHGVMAFFAQMPSSKGPPALVVALVIVDEVLSLGCDQFTPLRLSQRLLLMPVRKLFSPLHKAVLVPLIARAGLPGLAADVAELSAAGAGLLKSVLGRDGGVTRATYSCDGSHR